jgi:hypothetical protein
MFCCKQKRLAGSLRSADASQAFLICFSSAFIQHSAQCQESRKILDYCLHIKSHDEACQFVFYCYM